MNDCKNPLQINVLILASQVISKLFSGMRKTRTRFHKLAHRIPTSYSRLDRQVTRGKTGLIWVPLRSEGAKTGPWSAAAAPDARWTKDISETRSELNMSPRDGVGGGRLFNPDKPVEREGVVFQSAWFTYIIPYRPLIHPV